jgi:hypothetical protein
VSPFDEMLARVEAMQLCQCPQHPTGGPERHDA